jgi:hypothetical protein
MTNSPTRAGFEVMSKRRKGYPSETNVKRGLRSVRGGEKELVEKLGRRDPCPCGSGRRFAKCCMTSGRFRRRGAGGLLAVSGRTQVGVLFLKMAWQSAAECIPLQFNLNLG